MVDSINILVDWTYVTVENVTHAHLLAGDELDFLLTLSLYIRKASPITTENLDAITLPLPPLT